MIILGYPGENASDSSTRMIFWVLSMIPFVLIVLDLSGGLKKSLDAQAPSVRGLISTARWLTIISWSFYPVVYLLPVLGLQGGTTRVAVQIGYAIADIVSKVGLGVLIYTISARKSEIEITPPNLSPAVAS